MQHNHPYQADSSIPRPLGIYRPADPYTIYNTGFDSGFRAGTHVGYIEGLEAGVRLLQHEIMRSRYPLSLTHQGGGLDLLSRVTTTVTNMPPTMSTASSYTHIVAPSLLRSTNQHETSVNVWRPFDSDNHYKCTITVASTVASQVQPSTSVAASGQAIVSSPLLSTATAAGISANSDDQLMSHPDASEHSVHPSTSQMAESEKGIVTPEVYRQPASSSQLSNDNSDEEIDVGIEMTTPAEYGQTTVSTQLSNDSSDDETDGTSSGVS